MNQYGIVLSNKSTKDQYTISLYFRAMDYLDWSLFVDSPDMYEKSSIRYLADKYIISATKESDGTSSSLSSIDISNLPTPMCKEFIDKLVEKSGFGNTDQVANIVNRSKMVSSTIIGAYDMFIYIHGGIDIYLKMLKCDIAERCQFISVLERITGIVVKERFDIAVQTQSELDLITPNGKYRPTKNGRATTGLRHMREPQPEPQNTSNEDSSSFEAILNQSRNELSRALQEGSMGGKRKSFDWMKDNSELSRIENDPGMEMDSV